MACAGKYPLRSLEDVFSACMLTIVMTIALKDSKMGVTSSISFWPQFKNVDFDLPFRVRIPGREGNVPVLCLFYRRIVGAGDQEV